MPEVLLLLLLLLLADPPMKAGTRVGLLNVAVAAMATWCLQRSILCSEILSLTG